MTEPKYRPFRRRAAACAATLGCTLAGSLVLAQGPETGADRSARAATASAGKRPSAPVTLNFVNADIEAVSRAMAAMIDRQIIVDPRVKGVITLYSEQPLTLAQAYANYQAALRGLGFSVVDSGGLLKVVPEADAKLQAGTVIVGGEEARSSQVLTQIFRLNHENPNNLVAVLRPLISPNNTINANPGNNSLIITDYADNLSRLAKIIAALDQPAAADVEVIPLQHAIASDMAALVQRLGDSGAGIAPGAVAAGGMTVMADARSNALIVRAANAARLATIRSLVERLDRPGVGGPAGAIHVVYLKNADAVKLAAVLRAAFGSAGGSGGGASSVTPVPQAAPVLTTAANTSGALSAAATTPVAASAQPSTGGFIQADPATNSLVITAAEPLYRQIRGVIDQLDVRRAQVFVETMIVEMDAQKAAEFGFQWQGLVGKKGDRFGLAASTNFGSAGNLLGLSTSASNLGASGSTSSTSGLSVNGLHGLNLGLLQKVNGVYTLSALARFLESTGAIRHAAADHLLRRIWFHPSTSAAETPQRPHS